ncbi:hypothetical protein JCM8547_002804 [Rhodosporidiobolus lusitaniae]
MTFVERFRGGNQIPDVNLSGRTVLITGANTGLGLEAAIHYARLSPARLILAVRTVSTGEEAASRIVSETPLSRDRIEVWQLDLSSFDNVVAFSRRCQQLERLDIAILNAAVAGLKWKTTSEGWESMLQVNVISTGLQAVQLLPVLRRTGDLPTPPGGEDIKPHLSIIASDVSFIAAFTEQHAVPSKHSSYLAALNDEKLFNAFDRYNTSKLLEVGLARELAKVPMAEGVVVNTVNPGLTKSGLRREAPGVFERFFNLIARDTADSAKNYVFAGVTDTDALNGGIGGAYVSLCQVKPPVSSVTTPEGVEMHKKILGELVELWKGIDGEAVKAVFS